MKKRGIWIPALILGILAAAALVVFLSTARFDTTLRFTVRDAVSRQWVWDATVTLQDRVIRSFFQSDAGPIEYQFNRLAPGRGELTVSAPSYEPASVPVALKRGRNALPDPIDLVAYEIPNLDRFIIFEDYEGSDLLLEIRPVGTNGQAVVNHPCLDLRIGARISTQMKDGLYVQEETESGSERGEELFRGQAEWSWDAEPETVFRYSARIPGAQIQKHQAPYRVIDYLILVPDMRRTNAAELDGVLQKVWNVRTQEELASYLDGFKDKFRYFITTSWNVKGGPR